MNDPTTDTRFTDSLKRRLSAGLLCIGLTLFVVPWLRAGDDSPATAAPSGTTSPAASPETDDLRRELDEILAQPAFRRIRHRQMEAEKVSTPSDLSWLEKPFKWLWELLTSGAKGMSGLGGIWSVLAWTALAIVVCLIIWLIVRAINSYRHAQAVLVTKTLRAEEGEQDLPPGDVSADEYRRRASEFAAEARFREAIGQLILGAMSRTERQGLIRFRRGLTHRDYLRALRSREMAHGSFRTLVGIYEPICFGRRPASNENFQAAEKAYATGFEEMRALEAAR